mmetsp:Transcript_16994/g.25951  ORF Transcript_16994/g.25951 Transcript_16994/m.25951 type:complete len:344 (-) Transcript_16994:63-1094(-)
MMMMMMTMKKNQQQQACLLLTMLSLTLVGSFSPVKRPFLVHTSRNTNYKWQPQQQQQQRCIVVLSNDDNNNDDIVENDGPTDYFDALDDLDRLKERKQDYESGDVARQEQLADLFQSKQDNIMELRKQFDERAKALGLEKSKKTEEAVRIATLRAMQGRGPTTFGGFVLDEDPADYDPDDELAVSPYINKEYQSSEYYDDFGRVADLDDLLTEEEKYQIDPFFNASFARQLWEESKSIHFPGLGYVLYFTTFGILGTAVMGFFVVKLDIAMRDLMIHIGILLDRPTLGVMFTERTGMVADLDLQVNGLAAQFMKPSKIYMDKAEELVELAKAAKALRDGVPQP